MRRRTVTIVAVAVLLGTPAASVMAGPGMKRNVVGVIAGIERHSPPILQITSKGRKAQEVRTDDKTQYVRWVTHKEASHDTRASADELVVGSCVDVEPRTGDPGSAKVVRISDEPAGSNLDPCRGRR